MIDGLIYDHYPFRNATPPGWSVTAIEEIASDVASGFPSGAHNSEGRGVPHVRPMNIDREGRFDLSETKFVEGEVPRILRKGDVLFNNTNSPELIGKTTDIAVDLPLAYSNHMTRITLERGMNPRFVARQLHYLWMSGYFRHRCKNHVNQASIASEPLSKTVPLLVAPEPEQSRIADALDELLSDLYAGVKALEETRRILKQYRAAVLNAAVEGALTAEWRKAHPDVEPASELLKRILAERRQRWEEAQLKKYKDGGKEPPRNWKANYESPPAPDVSKLSALPEGWCWARWSQAGLSQNGRPFPSSDYQDDGVKLLRPGNLHASGRVEWTPRNTRCLPIRYANNSPELLVGEGELVINLTAQSLKDEFLGRVCMTSSKERCLLNQRLARLTPIQANPQYFLCLFKSAHFRAFVAGLNTGSLIQHMFTSQVDEYVFPLPPLAEQAAISEFVEDQLSVVDHLESDLEAKLKRAAALRQSILRAAFEGTLVQQDPNDEPASELLKHIAAERAERDRQAKEAKKAAKRAKLSKPKQGQNVSAVTAG